MEAVEDVRPSDSVSNMVDWLREQLKQLQAMGLSGAGANDRARVGVAG